MTVLRDLLRQATAAAYCRRVVRSWLGQLAPHLSSFTLRERQNFDTITPVGDCGGRGLRPKTNLLMMSP